MHHRYTRVPVGAVGAEPEAARSRVLRLSSPPAPKFQVHKARLSTLACPVYHIGEAICNITSLYIKYITPKSTFTMSTFVNSRSFPGGVSYSRESTPDSGGSHPYLEAYHRDTAGKSMTNISLVY